MSFSQQVVALDVFGVSDRKAEEFGEAVKELKSMTHTGLVVSMLRFRRDLCQDGRLVRRRRDVVQQVRGCYRGSCCEGLWIGILFLVAELSFVVAVSVVVVFVHVLA